MSDRTNTSPVPQAESTQQQAAAPDPAAVAAIRAVEAPNVVLLPGETPAAPEAEQAAVDVQAALKAANKTLDAFTAAVRNATDANYQLGRLAAQFVAECLAASPGKALRSSAVERLAERMMQESEDSLSLPLRQAMTNARQRVNVLLRGHAVAELLGDGRGVEKGDGSGRGRGKKGGADKPLPWNKLREFSPLVERLDDDHTERWSVLSPETAEAGKALVAEAAVSAMDNKALGAAVAVLVQRRVEAVTQAKIAKAKAEQAAALAAQQEAAAKARDVATATAEVAAAEQAAGQAKAEDRAAMTAAVEQAKAKLLAEQQAADAKRREAEIAAQKAAGQRKASEEASRKQAEADAKAAVKRDKADKAKQDKAQQQAADAGPAQDGPKAPPPPCNQGTNLLAIARRGTAKDVAEMACELIVGADAPDDVFHELLKLLDGHKELSAIGRRAAQAGLAALLRAEKASKGPSPAEVAAVRTVNPSANGQLAAAGAA